MLIPKSDILQYVTSTCCSNSIGLYYAAALWRCNRQLKRSRYVQLGQDCVSIPIVCCCQRTCPAVSFYIAAAHR